MSEVTQMAEGRDGSLEGRPVGILVADGVEQVEVTAPRDALRAAGAAVRILSPDGRAVRGYHYLTPQDVLEVDGPIRADDAGELGGLVLPGGLGGPDTLRTNEEAVGLVRACWEAGTSIGVICHGPWLLVEAGGLPGRTLTCVPALRRDVTNAGATYLDEPVHVDREARPLLVSGRNFEAAEAFAATLVRELGAIGTAAGPS